MIQFSNIVKKWRENDFSGESQDSKNNLQFNAGAQKILKEVSENCDHERESSQKKYSDVLEQLNEKKEVVNKTRSKPATKRNKINSSPKEKVSFEEKVVVEKDTTPQKREYVEVKSVPKNIDWEEDDFTQGLFDEGLSRSSSVEKSFDEGLVEDDLNDVSEDHQDQNFDEEATDKNATSHHRGKHSYQRKHRNHRNTNKSKHRNNRLKEHGYNGHKKEKRHYPKKEEVETTEHLNIESVLKSMKSSNHEEENTHEQGNERRSFPRKNDKRSRHKWV